MRSTSIGFLAIGLAILVSGCGPKTVDLSENPVASEPTAQNTAESIASLSTTISNPETDNITVADSSELSPGHHCYTFDDGVVNTYLRLTLDEQNQLQGDARSTVQNEELAYYTSYTQVFSGTLTEIGAAVDITTWIEYDVQNSREDWTITSETLQTEDALLELASCQEADTVFQDASGLEASDLTDGATAIHTRRVTFNPGESAATVSNAVIRGERDVYLLGASGGQQMDLSITSLENNAVFDVVSPSGYILAREAMDETVFLSHTGDYQVIVGGTRGNATYELTVGIQ